VMHELFSMTWAVIWRCCTTDIRWLRCRDVPI